MDESDFWSRLEYLICDEMNRMPACRQRGMWCDGVIPSEYHLDDMHQFVLGTAWIGTGPHTQDSWSIKVTLPASPDRRENLPWFDLLPQDGHPGWLSVDLDRQQFEITLTRAQETSLDASMREKEEAMIGAFILPAKQRQWRALLPNKNRRMKMLERLNHHDDFDPRFATDLPSNSDVVALLRSRGAPEFCHLISDAEELDGKEMPLSDAIAAAERLMWGTLIGCIPGHLAYYYGEAGERRVILERKQ